MKKFFKKTFKKIHILLKRLIIKIKQFIKKIKLEKVNKILLLTLVLMICLNLPYRTTNEQIQLQIKSSERLILNYSLFYKEQQAEDYLQMSSVSWMDKVSYYNLSKDYTYMLIIEADDVSILMQQPIIAYATKNLDVYRDYIIWSADNLKIVKIELVFRLTDSVGEIMLNRGLLT